MVYHPLEDSFLLQKWVAKFSKGKRVLDMGTGSGIQAITAFEAGAEKVIGADLDSKSVIKAGKNANARNARIEFRQSNLFSNIRSDEKFDLIIFNPPYLPYDENLPGDIDLSGGEVGNELSIEFLKQARDYLENGGFILLISSSISNPFEIFSNAESLGYVYEILEDTTLNMETLYCVKFELSE
ncbi:methyltransferase [archaeon CG07_land_8_20_14_0_80_38_8]|nr:MAG: methyltransferase [archaeon CG07_land_8_20_14_0_80_38_8]PIU88606.1 MAG: methyltransferase [archaeon CG06_land_8_20_14_3_00_37_11]